MSEARCGRWLLAALFIVLSCARPSFAVEALDDFEDLTRWSASASAGTQVEIARDSGRSGLAMRIDFDLHGSGYLIVRKAFAITLPANYAFSFAVRGDAPVNNLEFKLVDRAGQNVWWYKQRNFAFPSDWQVVTIKKPRLEFAWGPAGGGMPKRIGYIELAIVAGSGGKGSVWIDELRLEERNAPAATDGPPKVTACTSIADHEPERLVDQNPQTSWHSGALAADQWVLIDFTQVRDYGGLVIDWDPDDYATAYLVRASDDGQNWTTLYSTTTNGGGRNYIYAPDAASRFIRLDLQQSSRGQGYGIREVRVKPFAFSRSLNEFFAAIAADAPIGTFPKYFIGKQTYWTVVGVDGAEHKALMNEEGMIEIEEGGVSIEPFLYLDGRLVTWNDVRTTQELARGYLPIPTVTWHDEGMTLSVTAFAGGKAGDSTLFAHYRIDNSTDQHRGVDLLLAIRPFQVLPPWQSLNIIGGVTPIRELLFAPRTVWVNQDRAIVSLTPPDHFGAARFEEGLVTDFLAQDKLPPRTRITDSFGYGSGALQYHLSVPPGDHQDVYIAIPFHEANRFETSVDADGAPAYFAAQLETVGRNWESVLDHVDFQLPSTADAIIRTLKSTLAYILINRDGATLRPGPRNYARSWIRDGAMMSAALLSMGSVAPVRDFARWFAQHQLADGRIPCCVDARGSDPTPEYDSDGEFIYTVAEYYRYTRDIGFVNEMWPSLVKAADSIAALRRQTMGDQSEPAEKPAFYGLLPESISHEGYSGHPVHSYWDDFFALRGLKDAASLAASVGDGERATNLATECDDFRNDLYASISRTMTENKIDYIPGSVELGDFDATSTAIALTLCSEQSYLPEPALSRTFERYYSHVQERQHQEGGDDAYTPYELRNVGAFVRLGQRERAFELLQLLMTGQRPAAWNEWAEVVWRDPAAPKFIGDMPHTWIGSSYIQSVRTMFAYERDADRSLVIAAGLPLEWVTSDSGVAVKRLPTYYGVLHYSLRVDSPHALRLSLAGDLRLPDGKIVVRPPLPEPLAAVTVNGKPIQTFNADSATIGEFPADVVLEYAALPPAP
ncbi:MAG TPA: discoidin domain-containing protein [Candidatus Kryptonia bacterium]|nr:discoidin domain-containing protein [Candidatus Kryptonia bacterium]